MSLTRSTFIKLLKILLAGLVISIIIGYTIWRSANFVRGPSINIFEPVNWSAISSPTITIKGRAERVNSLLLNGHLISMDESGNFNESLILFSGINILTIEAGDQFGRSVKRELRLTGDF